VGESLVTEVEAVHLLHRIKWENELKKAVVGVVQTMALTDVFPVRPGKYFCIKLDRHGKFEFWNDPAMRALIPPATSRTTSLLPYFHFFCVTPHPEDHSLSARSSSSGWTSLLIG
jgi:hypothetical protein